MKKLSQDNIIQELSSTAVVLYGAGMIGKKITQLMLSFQINVKYIIDDDENKWGTNIEGVAIISYTEFVELSKKYKKIYVILTSVYGKIIVKRLEKLENIQIYEMYDWIDSTYRVDCWLNYINEDNRLLFKREIDFLSSSLADDESVQVLNGINNYLQSKDLKYIYDICTEQDQYFIPEVIKAIDRPLSIVDVGAYEGELYWAIKKHNIDLERWYCFEADCNNYMKLLQQSAKENMSDIQICIRGGVWSHNGTLYFEAGKGTESKIVDYKTNSSIEVISLDSYFEDKRCDFIKMDIEGAEYPALCGGINIIKRDRPILAISIYHSLDDYYRIPKYLINELQNYKYYIRHHSLILSETVFYAIPSELLKCD